MTSCRASVEQKSDAWHAKFVTSDLFVINKTDLAPHVGADLEVMRADTNRMRPNPETRPWVMTNLKTLDGLAEVVAFIEKRGMLRQV